MEFVVKSLVQAVVALLIASVLWGVHWTWARLRGQSPERWRSWLGLFRPPSLRRGGILFAAFLVAGGAVAWLSQRFVPGFEELVRESPQFAIALLPLPGLLVAAAAYSFLMTGFSEELLFRGVVAKCLMRWLGDGVGNAAQALLFGLLHVAIVYLAVPEPGFALVAVGATFPTAMAWIGGRAMVRDGRSLWAPWLAHSGVNLATVAAYCAMFT